MRHRQRQILKAFLLLHVFASCHILDLRSFNSNQRT